MTEIEKVLTVEIEHLNACLRMAHDRKKQLLHHWYKAQKSKEVTWDTVIEFLEEQITSATPEGAQKLGLVSVLAGVLQLQAGLPLGTKEITQLTICSSSVNQLLSEASVSSTSGSPKSPEKLGTPADHRPFRLSSLGETVDLTQKGLGSS